MVKNFTLYVFQTTKSIYEINIENGAEGTTGCFGNEPRITQMQQINADTNPGMSVLSGSFVRA